MNLTAKNSVNDLAIEMMFGKALCAYANWQDAKKYTAFAIKMNDDYCKAISERHETACASEYEATVRCLAMLTVEHLPQVCMAVIEQAKEEFGI